ncbi:MAG: hypothetical protein ABJT35_16090 [Parasphingorhabdus sp.]
MQSAGTILWRKQPDYPGYFCGFRIIIPVLLIVIAVGIVPALASEGSTTAAQGGSVNGRIVTIASARVVSRFTMTANPQASISSSASDIHILRRTAHHNCAALIGPDYDEDIDATCELR